MRPDVCCHTAAVCGVLEEGRLRAVAVRGGALEVLAHPKVPCLDCVPQDLSKVQVQVQGLLYEGDGIHVASPYRTAAMTVAAFTVWTSKAVKSLVAMIARSSGPKRQ